jgi:hypothetical protein
MPLTSGCRTSNCYSMPSLCNDFREMAKNTGPRAAQPTSPEPEQSTITAGDIVQKLMRIRFRGNTGTLMERVRSWTKEKFLVPLEGLGQGPGSMPDTTPP